MPFFDTHAHLDQSQFDTDRDAVLTRGRQLEVEDVLCVGISADSSRVALQLAEGCQGVCAGVGIQPNYSAEAADGDWQRIEEMADHPRVVAIGETGLDRHWDFAPIHLQRDYFDRHLRLAAERGLPVVIHCREAEAELLPMLRAAASRGPLRGVLHAFSSNEATAAECLELGLYISFAGSVTYKNKKFQTLRAVATSVPDDRILIETDSPYLVPEPLRGRQKRNEPAHLVHTARCLAALRSTDLKQFAVQTTANARRLFRRAQD